MKRFLSVVIVLAMLLAIPPVAVNTDSVLKTGDYVQFGSYNNEPILWKVINIDENGPMLLSDKIICLKAFDSAGSYHTDSSRKLWGSNYWKDSNIRQWLNSNEAKIKWLQNAPTKINLNDGYNAYAEEKGFLADGNFTAQERKFIKPVQRHVFLSEVDIKKVEGGSSYYLYDGHMQNIVQNYNSAYYHTVTDSVFFLNTKELKEYLYDRGWEYRAYPTEKVVENSVFKDYTLSTVQFWHNWLDTPQTDVSHCVRFVNSIGYALDMTAVNSNGGVRPALYIDLKSMTFKSGSGSENDPYVVAGGNEVVQPKPGSTNNGSDIKIIIDGNPLVSDVAPITVNGRVLVPFRAIFEALGAYVEWDAFDLLAFGGKDKTYVFLSPDNPTASIYTITSDIKEKVTLESLDRTEGVNSFITLDAAPTVKNGRIMVPARFIAETLGAKVGWDNNTKAVRIITK